MKYILILSFSLSLLTLNGQTTFNGKITGGDSHENLGYVNIGVVGKNVGTVSNIHGNFELEIPRKHDADTLKISMIGYESKVFRVADFKKHISKNPTIHLAEIATDLKEVVIPGKKLKKKILGNKTRSKNVSAGFSSNLLGNEVGLVIKVKKRPTYITNFTASVARNEYDSLKFRLNFYDVKNGRPNKSILNENIFINSEIKEGVISVDLSQYNIVVEDDFFVALEWIEDLGEGGLFFSAGFFNTPLIARETSQGGWHKVGLVGLGFTVTALY